MLNHTETIYLLKSALVMIIYVQKEHGYFVNYDENI
jgi:hypothetical protein